MASPSLLFIALFVLVFTNAILETHGRCYDIYSKCHSTYRASSCYDFKIRSRCCATCAAYASQINGPANCRYGDHEILFKRPESNVKYRCKAYVGWYGKLRCRNDTKFRYYCCQSCRS